MNEQTERMSRMAALMKFLGKSNNRYKRYYNLELHMHCNHCLNGYLFSRHSLFFSSPFCYQPNIVGSLESFNTNTSALSSIHLMSISLLVCELTGEKINSHTLKDQNRFARKHSTYDLMRKIYAAHSYIY